MQLKARLAYVPNVPLLEIDLLKSSSTPDHGIKLPQLLNINLCQKSATSFTS